MTIPNENKNKNQRSRTDIYEMLFHSRRFGHIQKTCLNPKLVYKMSTG